jgi:thiamine transport system ATP-binding protein
VLNVNQLQYRYHTELFQFDLQLEPGTITALIGPSGAGKSTLLALIAGFIQPISGDILFDSRSLLKKEPYLRPFAMLFQEHNLFSHLSVRENIGLGLHPGLRLSAAQWDLVGQAAEQVGLADLLQRSPDQLSGGQKQRVALARCFVQPHPIWLLDEPFSALDPILREEMLLLVKRLASERHISVLIVTHHINDAKVIASDFALVAEHRVMVADKIAALTASHSNPLLSEFVRASERQ